MKQFIFKYTLKEKGHTKDNTVFYVSHYKEAMAKKALVDKLDCKKDNLVLSKRNVPFKVRKKLSDPNNKEFEVFLYAKEKPKEQNFDKKKLFDMKSQLLNTLKYKVIALISQDVNIIKEYSNGVNDYKVQDRIYESTRKSIIANGFEDKNLKPGLDLTLLEFLDSYKYDAFSMDSALTTYKNKK